MRQLDGMKVIGTLTWGGLDGKRKQPIQRCMAERPEVSRGHSTAKWKDHIERAYERSGKGRTMGAGEVSVRYIDV